MKALWITFIAVATFGSLYPFDFDLAGPPGGLFRALIDAASASTSRGDVAGNFILFLPIGLFSMLAMDPRHGAWARFLRAGAISVAVAAALQLLQLFLPSRDASLADVVWNAAGQAAGAALAVLAALSQRETSPMRRGLGRAALLPLALIAAWLAYRLVPYVPSIDLQAFKDSLKPILNDPLDPLACSRDAAGWTLTAFLLREAWSGARIDRFLPLLLASVFALEILIVSNGIDRADLVGAAVATALWFGALGRMPRPEWALLALLAGTIAVGGLSPLTVRAEVAPFQWMPFSGFLGGSMYLNAQSALEKTFLYGSLVFLAQRVLRGRTRGTVVAMAFVGLIEVSQTRLIDHSPEITDPLLVLLASLAIFILEREDAARAAAPPAVQPPGPKPEATAPLAAAIRPPRARRQQIHATPDWASLDLTLPPSQHEQLAQLAESRGVSVAGTATQVITHSLKRGSLGAKREPPGLDAPSARSAQAGPADASPGAREGQGAGGSIAITVRLRKDHLESLTRLAEGAGVSASEVAGAMIEAARARADR